MVKEIGKAMRKAKSAQEAAEVLKQASEAGGLRDYLAYVPHYYVIDGGGRTWTILKTITIQKQKPGKSYPALLLCIFAF